MLTEKGFNTRALKTKIADVWRPAMGINIKELEQGLFLFQFYRKEDLHWVLQGGPWTFDNAMLALEGVATGENPAEVKPYFVNIWIQLHNLPMGYMTESVGKQLGNFFGEFLEYDAKNNSSIWREYMRVRIRIDTRKPLKRKKKIVKKNGQELTVICKYERLGEFCFTCGLVNHTDRFCRSNRDRGNDEGTKEWGSWLRAPPRRAAGQTQSKWLRDENDDTWEARIGGEINQQRNAGGDNSKNGKEGKSGSDYRREMPTESENGNNISKVITAANLKGYNTTSNMLYDLNEEESDGLQLEDRKRRRGEIIGTGFMEIDTAHQNKETQVGQYQGHMVKNNDSNVVGGTGDNGSKNEQMAGAAAQPRQTL